MVNDQAGARTGLASIISAVLILLTLLLFTPLFYFLPHAVLAAIILIAVYKLIRFREAGDLWKLDRKDFWMMLATFLGTLTLGITTGIGIGVLLSLAWIIYENLLSAPC
jgi:SulP family sulfate permease